MLLNHKLNNFINGNNIVTEITKSDLNSLSVGGIGLKKCFFENHVNIDSYVISYSKTPRVFFGAYSYINDGGYIRSDVFVGRYCSIGRRVTIAAGMHSIDALSTSPILCPTSYKKNITIIHSDVWIGDGVIIMPGITIGKGAIIGSNAVVTKDVEPYTIVGGIPAKKIRNRFDEHIIAEMINFNYEDYPLEVLKMGVSKFGNDILSIVSYIKSEEIEANVMDFTTYAFPST